MSVAGLAAAVFVSPATTREADAFGDVCYRDVIVKGGMASTLRGAHRAAIDAWEARVARQYGPRHANWYYSGDRTFECSWDVTGTRIRCIARAIPCGPKR
jgi:hypothetical protein